MTCTKKVSPKRAMIFLVFWVVWLGAAGRIGNCQNLTIDSQKGNMKESVMFTVSVKNAPNSVQCFGFEVHFNPQVLAYSQYERGEMVEKCKYFSCVQVEPGVLRCGGFNTAKNTIPSGQSGNVLFLYFKKVKCQNSTLSIDGEVDDLKDWETGSGRFTCWRN
ncbi:MAG: cohesin domain-containing protein [bacterium]